MDTFTHEQIEQIAQAASEMYGQAWAGLPQWSKDIWRQMAWDADPSVLHTDAQRYAAAAKREWLKKQATPEAEPVEVKTRKKRGND